MNEIFIKFLLTADKFMPKLHLDNQMCLQRLKIVH